MTKQSPVLLHLSHTQTGMGRPASKSQTKSPIFQSLDEFNNTIQIQILYPYNITYLIFVQRLLRSENFAPKGR